MLRREILPLLIVLSQHVIQGKELGLSIEESQIWDNYQSGTGEESL